jgi:hypothetical protein
MKNVPILQDLWDHVNPSPTPLLAPVLGTVVVPLAPPTEAELVATAKGKRIALSQLALSVKDDLITIVNMFTDPRDAWNHLKTMYQTSNSAHILHLRDQLSKARMKEGQMIAVYLKELINLQHQLTSIGEVVEERELVERILNTLPESFDSVINSLNNSSQLPSLADMSGRLLLHENRMQIRQKNQTGEEALMVCQRSEEALLVRRGGYPFSTARGSYPVRRSDEYNHDGYGHGGHGRGRNYDRGHSQVGPCNFCGAYGHLLRNCEILSQEISKRKTERDRMRSFSHSTHLVKDNYSDEVPGQVDVFQLSLDSLDIDKNSD